MRDSVIGDILFITLLKRYRRYPAYYAHEVL